MEHEGCLLHICVSIGQKKPGRITPISLTTSPASLPTVDFILGEKQPSARKDWEAAVFQSNRGVHQVIHFPLWLMECQSVK